MALLLRSIATRFSTANAVIAAIAFLCLTGIVAYQVERSIERQEEKLENLSDANLAQTLDADVRLAGARIRFLLNDTARRVAAISSRSDTTAAVVSRNVVAMWETLGPAATSADVDSIVVLDHAGKVIGASYDSADLIGLNQKIAALPFFDDLRRLLQNNRPDRPDTLSLLLPAAQTGRLERKARDNQVAQAVFVPLFDEFGEVLGGLLAIRKLRMHENLLVELANITSTGIVVFHDGEVISRAGYPGEITPHISTGTRTNISDDGRHILRCSATVDPLVICTLKPIEDLYATQSELTKIGKKEEETLLRALGIFGVLATLAFIACSVFVSRQITRPLRRITNVVSSAAAGQYEDKVEGTGRDDEVGDIARAVVSLQASVKERDSLRSKVQSKNVILKRQEGELRHQNSLFDAALNNMSHGLCMFDEQAKLIVSNKRYLELFGLKQNQVVAGMSLKELASLQREAAGVAEGEEADDGEYAGWPRNRRAVRTTRLDDGRIILTTSQPLLDGGWVAIFEDVTERERARDHLAHLASHDSLTGLPNRMRFREHLDSLIKQCEVEGGYFGILCLDLDEFKTVNDSLGHPIGDDLLRQVSRRLLKLTGDRHLVVRLGGDEFAVVTGIPCSAPEMKNLARDIISDLSRPFHVGDNEIAIGVSIGITISENGDLDADEMFKQADLALYEAKADGRNTWRFYEEKMATVVNARRELITNLSSALENGELVAHFQPQVRLDDGSITGFEALMRWEHPTRGMISPAEFIPIAEETGIIVTLGEWILREACKVATTWPEPIRVAVNISPRQLKSPGFTTALINTIAATGLRPERLELEVTESVLLGDDAETLSKLHQAKSFGVKISMDDFGTGYSSLSCLRSFPFDKIKIDQSFVRSMLHSKESESIVRAIIELADSLDITTTAEGVESQQLVTMLTACGCTEAQGYLFGKPKPAAQAMEGFLAQFARPRIAAVR